MLKVEVLGMERLGSSEVRFPVVVFKSTDGTVWTQVVGAPEYVTFQASELLTITNDAALTDQQKVAALAALMKAQVEGYGVSEAEEAVSDLAALGITYPVTIDL